jgi:amino-acid N-acetyltransferase
VIIGCAALYPFSDQESGELACMAVHPDYRRDGKAAKLLTHIERQGLKLGITKLFVLTTQTAHWFIEQGFVETLINNLPVERAALYNYQRKSKVFVKSISSKS